VNYRHDFAAWFPYAGHHESDLTVFSTAKLEGDAERVSLQRGGGRLVERFTAACGFLVLLCRDLASEMARRSPSRDSFHNLGMLHLEARLREAHRTIGRSSTLTGGSPTIPRRRATG
jgi:hypothetical protein